MAVESHYETTEPVTQPAMKLAGFPNFYIFVLSRPEVIVRTETE